VVAQHAGLLEAGRTPQIRRRRGGGANPSAAVGNRPAVGGSGETWLRAYREPVESQPTGTGLTAAGEVARGVVRAALEGLELPWSETRPGLFAVTLPGTAKLSTACALEVGRYGLAVRAFVARRPDENASGVHRWLLQRNLKLRGVCFSLDALGDIHLTGTLALESVTAAAVDQVLGTVAETADASFNPILELGFATSIKREWAWRRARGESTANLAAFAHLDPERNSPAAQG
jgi:hypothetical protein